MPTVRSAVHPVIPADAYRAATFLGMTPPKREGAMVGESALGSSQKSCGSGEQRSTTSIYRQETKKPNRFCSRLGLPLNRPMSQGERSRLPAIVNHSPSFFSSAARAYL